MTTQRIVIPASQWVKITDVSIAGTMSLHFGSIRITEQTVLPVGIPQDTPKSGTLTGNGAEGSYFDVNTGEYVYAYGLSDSELDVTPKGGIL